MTTINIDMKKIGTTFNEDLEHINQTKRNFFFRISLFLIVVVISNRSFSD